MVPSLRSLEYHERLDKLGWTSLEDRRRRGDLIQLHKLTHKLEIVQFVGGDQRIASHGLDSPAGNTRHGHLSITRGRSNHCEQRYNFFINRTAGWWNVLPTALKSEKDTNKFKMLLDKLEL